LYPIQIRPLPCPFRELLLHTCTAYQLTPLGELGAGVAPLNILTLS
jgi:hypothetical protein